MLVAGFARAAEPSAAPSAPAPAQPAGPVIVPPAPLEPPGATQTLRLASGSELWTIPYAALQQFVADGTITDRQLLQLAANSGWPDDQLRAALARPYAVSLVPLSKFLYSPAGVAFLQQQTQAFRPLMARGRDVRVEGMRAAILRTAKSGTISAMTILRELPTTFVVELGGQPTQRCSSLPCVNPVQCTSTMSWLVFLPACLQAASNGSTAATAP
ncbi:alpha/beta hydrolase [Synechococcus sp. HK05]|nr:alpha/beta hydrolase [Synechococcus sp. HK05]